MNCSCPMNNARGPGKKKKAKNTDSLDVDTNSNEA